MISFDHDDIECRRDLAASLRKNLPASSLLVVMKVMKPEMSTKGEKPWEHLVQGAWSYYFHFERAQRAPSPAEMLAQLKDLNLVTGKLAVLLMGLFNENLMALSSGSHSSEFQRAWDRLVGKDDGEGDLIGLFRAIAELVPKLVDLHALSEIAIPPIGAFPNGTHNLNEALKFTPPGSSLAFSVLKALALAGQEKSHMVPITRAVHQWATGETPDSAWNKRGFEFARRTARVEGLID
jgi:hypothetical protein